MEEPIEASSEKAESELVSWESVALLPLGMDLCFRNLISSANNTRSLRGDGEQLKSNFVAELLHGRPSI